jgi:hypothetical protein
VAKISKVFRSPNSPSLLGICVPFSLEMKYLGEAYVLINMKQWRQGNGVVTLLQFHFVEKVLSNFRFTDYQPTHIAYYPSVLF